MQSEHPLLIGRMAQIATLYRAT